MLLNITHLLMLRYTVYYTNSVISVDINMLPVVTVKTIE